MDSKEIETEVTSMLGLLDAQLPPGVWVERGGPGVLHIPLPGRGQGSGRWVELQLRVISLDAEDRTGRTRGPGWEGRVWPGGETETGPGWEMSSWAAGWAAIG
jgi:hypothetical protein